MDRSTVRLLARVYQSRYLVAEMKPSALLLLLSLQAACASGTQNTQSVTPAESSPTPSAAVSTPHAREQRATATIDRFASRDFVGTREWFDATMRDRLSVATLRDTWSQCESEFGAFKSRTFNGATRLQGYTAMEYDLVFDRGHATARIVFDDQGRVAGLFVKRPGE